MTCSPGASSWLRGKRGGGSEISRSQLRWGWRGSEGSEAKSRSHCSEGGLPSLLSRSLCTLRSEQVPPATGTIGGPHQAPWAPHSNSCPF